MITIKGEPISTIRPNAIYVPRKTNNSPGQKYDQRPKVICPRCRKRFYLDGTKKTLCPTCEFILTSMEVFDAWRGKVPIS